VAAVGVLHPGEMGAAVAAALVDVGHDVLWASKGRSAETAERARRAGLEDAETVASLLARSEVVLSICPPAAAVEVAEDVRGFGGVFVDANAIAPETASAVSEIVGDSYLDGGIIGPPPTEAGTTRLYLSGTHGERVAGLFEGARIEARVLSSAGPMAASALKMAYAAWTKGSQALLLAVERTACSLGLEEELRAEWALSQPQLADRLRAAHRSAQAKGWRWAEEMRQIAMTFDAAGQPDGFHRAAAQVYDPDP
jgi:3-hydroxyisobutyrate dehydrogenase-like beta-hydroxyacid dehydrogenase